MKKTLLALVSVLAILCGCQSTSRCCKPCKKGGFKMFQSKIEESIANDTRVFKANPAIRAVDVRFPNRFGIVLAGHFYYPANFDASKKYPAIALSGPFGAVKEQSSGLYAQELAARGFVTVAFDPSFTGESSGMPRNVASPDLNTEDFSAAVDFLATRDFVDANRIGILGVCGWGGLAINAAAIDTRIKATVASTMYDMTRVIANGYNDADDSAEKRDALRAALNAQRIEDIKQDSYAPAGCNLKPEELTDATPQFIRDYTMYYETKRGFHPRSVNSVAGWNKTSALPFLNAKLLAYAGEIRSAVMVLHGEKAHSRYFSETAFKLLKGDNKELVIVPGANHTDLYDNFEKIPFDRIAEFYKKNL
ncbi:MAG: alpha/beta hydrolase [Victivallales bacterium]|nr:alpha/beta hydrolase [Victivallales bacterium]